MAPSTMSLTVFLSAPIAYLYSTVPVKSATTVHAVAVRVGHVVSVVGAPATPGQSNTLSSPCAQVMSTLNVVWAWAPTARRLRSQGEQIFHGSRGF